MNNTLTNVSLPQGFIEWKSSDSGYYPPGYFTHEYAFDFFNYAGIHRSVVSYTVPSSISIIDVTVITTDLAKDYSQATLRYEIEYVVEELDDNEEPV